MPNQHSLFAVYFLLSCLALFSKPAVVSAAPLAQTGIVTLTISNESDQTICNVYISAVTANDWGEDHLGEDTISPNETRRFSLACGEYDVLLEDCNENLLLDKRNIIVNQADKLIFTQTDANRAASEAHNQEGLAADQQSRSEETLAAYQALLTCVRLLGDRAAEGATLNNIAGVYQKQGRYLEALELYEQALAIWLEVGDRAGEGTALNGIGGLYYDRGRYSRAIEYFEQALAIAEEMGNRESEGTILNNIAAMYDSQGSYGEALERYEQALVIAREVGNRAGEGTTLNNIGLVYNSQGHYNQAMEYFEQALAILREMSDRAGEGATLNNIGLVNAKQGRYDQALEYFEQALTIRQEADDWANEGTTLNNIAALYANQGRYGQALERYEQALTIARKVGDRLGEGTTLHNIGLAYNGQGRYGEALEYFAQALAILREVGDRASEGATASSIGLVYANLGRYDEALEYFEQALAIMQEVGNRAGEGTALHNIGLVYDSQRHYAEALRRYEQALAIAQEVDGRADEGATLNNIAAVYAKNERYDEALARYEQSLVIAREIGDRTGEGTILNNIGLVYANQGIYKGALEQYKQALTILREVGDRTNEGITLHNIATVYDSQGRYVESLRYYDSAIDLLESVRSSAGSDEARTSFASDYIPIYDRIIDLYHQQGAVAQALWYSERGRARTLLDLLTTDRVQLSDNETAALLAAEQEAYAVRQSAQDALAKARAANPPDPAWVSEAEQALKDAEVAYQKVSDEIAARSDQLASLIPGRQKVLQLTDAQALLDKNTTLLSYWMLEDKTLAFVVTAKDAKIVELPQVTSQIVLSATESLYKWTNKDNPAPKPLRELYQALVAPLADRLKTSHVAIIPHQSLHYVPFVALTDGEHYFGQQYLLTVLPSASVLPFLAQNEANVNSTINPTALIFGNPQTDLPALPAAEAEAGAVAALFQTTVYTGAAASEAQLRTSIQHANIVHLAAHGNYNIANPLYSAIALASGEEQDGLLETREIFGLPLEGNNLVVLSACETTVNDLAKENQVALSRGDELVSLTRAFFFAGTPTVISSLWSVDDAATEKLMISFYTHWLQDGMSKAEALQAAQADVRADPRWTSPFYWAGFVLNGDPGATK